MSNLMRDTRCYKILQDSMFFYSIVEKIKKKKTSYTDGLLPLLCAILDNRDLRIN